MDDFQKLVERIRRWKWLVLAIGVAAMLAALAVTVGGGSSSTARSTVVVGASNALASRTPESDGVIARGYVELINSPQYQDRIRAEADLDPDVSIVASTIAESPFIEIAATAPTDEEAIAGATAFTRAFIADTRDSYEAILDARLEPLRAQVRQTATRISILEGRLASDSLSADEEAALRGELSQQRTEAAALATQLEGVTSSAGNPNLVGGFDEPSQATENQPAVIFNTVLGLLGGLILGCVVAIILGALQLRVTSPSVVRSRLGLPTLATISGGDTRQREEDLQSLANTMALSEPSVSLVAVTSPGVGEGKTLVASNLARFRAALGDRVILIDANLRGPLNGASARQPGLAQLLSSRGDLEDVLVETGIERLRVLPAGGPTREDPYVLLTGERFSQVLLKAAPEADLVVIDTPALLSAAESQVVCSLADRTILVLDSVGTQTAAAEEARDALERVHARILGVVLTRVPKRRLARSATPRPRPSRHPAPAEERGDRVAARDSAE